MNERNSDEIIDEFIREQAGQEAFWKTKLGLYVAFVFERLNVSKFAKDAGVTENEVRQYFGGEAASEPEETDEPDTVDETEDESADATEIFLNHVSLLEKDADNILDSAGPSPDGLLNQLDALNHQLNILIHIIAIHVKGGC